MYKIFTALMILIFFAIVQNVCSQSEVKTTKAIKVVVPQADKTNWFLGLGLTTYNLFEGVSTLPINPTDTSITTIGGSFAGAQSGIELRLTYKIDEEGDFYLPIALSYYKFSAKEQIPINRFYRHNFSHELFIITPTVGLYTRIINVPLVRSFLYGGIDIQPTYKSESTFIFKQTHITDPNPPASYVIERNPKGATWRLGGSLKIGVQGDLVDRWQINASMALNSMNLFLKNDETKELLTPSKVWETGESSVNAFIFSILLQYRLD